MNRSFGAFAERAKIVTFQFTEIQEKWLQALESGEYQQGHKWLRHDGCYCCLGVACEVMGFEYDLANASFKNGSRRMSWQLDKDVAASLGLRTQLGQLTEGVRGPSGGLFFNLASLNDNGMPFTEIAAYIRANPENVFVAPIVNYCEQEA